MSFSDSSSDDESANLWENELLDQRNNGFAFEPEYPESEIEDRLTAYLQARENGSQEEPRIPQTNEKWCTCEKCADELDVPQRLCCQSTTQIIGKKFLDKKCISETDAFEDVCLNRNVLEAALGTWKEFTDEEMDTSNKSFRLIAYRQYISWIFGWLGKDVRKVIPSCVVQKIRLTFPAPDNVYKGYKHSSIY